MIREFTPHLGASPSAVVDLLAQLIGDPPPDWVTHVGVRSPALLAWYRSSSLRKGLVLTGSLGGETLHTDPIELLPISSFKSASCLVTASYHAALDRGEEVAPKERITRWLASSDSLKRLVALRWLIRKPLPREFVSHAHRLALLDREIAVRQLAAMQLSGDCREPGFVASVEELFAILREPGVGEDSPDGEPDFNTKQGHANSRIAVLWSLGLLRTRTDGGRPDLAEIPALIETEILGTPLSAGADRQLYTLAMRELGGAEAFAMGVDQPLGLLELLRFIVHRHRIISRLKLSASDRYYWLTQTAEAICPSSRSPTQVSGPDPRPVAQAVYGPSPQEPMPRCTALPSYMTGRNPISHIWPAACE